MGLGQPNDGVSGDTIHQNGSPIQQRELSEDGKSKSREKGNEGEKQNLESFKS